MRFHTVVLAAAGLAHAAGLVVHPHQLPALRLLLQDPAALVRRDDDTNPDVPEGDEVPGKESGSDLAVAAYAFLFHGKIVDYVYLPQDPLPSAPIGTETIVVLTNRNHAYVSHNHGKLWEQVAPEEEIVRLLPNPHHVNHVYLMALNQKVVYSTDRGDNWKLFRVPSVGSEGLGANPSFTPLVFHPRRDLWLIWLGQEGCTTPGLVLCRTVAYVLKLYGKRWREVMDNVNECRFIVKVEQGTHNPDVLCERPKDQTGLILDVFVSEEMFVNDKGLRVLSNVVAFAEVGDYYVALVEQGGTLGQTTLQMLHDGFTWHQAMMPAGLSFSKHQRYAVVRATDASVWMHVTTYGRTGGEFGALLKSNSNGTYYRQALPHVNRDGRGYVDIEQIEGLEGVLVANVVLNPTQTKQGARKQLRTMVTHDDGSTWGLLTPPAVDADGNRGACYGAGRALEKCALHLHGYTERKDYRDTFGSPGAVGMMLGVGNVGSGLDLYHNSNTYLTRDGGATWLEVRKGVYMWEYGDQGGLVVLVNGEDMTNEVMYSTNQGQLWKTFKFNDEKVFVEDIATVPLDLSTRFLLITKLPMHHGDRSRVFQIDFSGLYSRQCLLDVSNVELDDDDFELWAPHHPGAPDGCLFGRETRYLRKIPGKQCFVGRKVPQPHLVVRVCGCRRQDFECDYNFVQQPDGTCKPVFGWDFRATEEARMQEQCFTDGVRNDAVEYAAVNGYRKLHISSCEGGEMMQEMRPCPALEAEFRQRHGLMLFAERVWVFVVAGVGAVVVLWVSYHVYVRWGHVLGLRKGVIQLEDGEEEYGAESQEGDRVTVASARRAVGRAYQEAREWVIILGLLVGGFATKVVGDVRARVRRGSPEHAYEPVVQGENERFVDEEDGDEETAREESPYQQV